MRPSHMELQEKEGVPLIVFLDDNIQMLAGHIEELRRDGFAIAPFETVLNLLSYLVRRKKNGQSTREVVLVLDMIMEPPSGDPDFSLVRTHHWSLTGLVVLEKLAGIGCLDGISTIVIHSIAGPQLRDQILVKAKTLFPDRKVEFVSKHDQQALRKEIHASLAR